MEAPVCCLFTLPGKCAHCGAHTADSVGFIFVLENGTSRMYCTAHCLISDFVQHRSVEELG